MSLCTARHAARIPPAKRRLLSQTPLLVLFRRLASRVFGDVRASFQHFPRPPSTNNVAKRILRDGRGPNRAGEIHGFCPIVCRPALRSGAYLTGNSLASCADARGQNGLNLSPRWRSFDMVLIAVLLRHRPVAWSFRPVVGNRAAGGWRCSKHSSNCRTRRGSRRRFWRPKLPAPWPESSRSIVDTRAGRALDREWRR